MSGNDIASEGWSMVDLQHNAYSEEFFKGMNVASIMQFVEKEVLGFELVALSGSHDYAYALQETVKSEEYHGADE